MKRFLGVVLGFLAFIFPLGLYIKTLSPSYLPVDSAEFALCAKFWGICHPPGFPLYTILGKLFTDWFFVGSLIYKMGLFSAIWGAATILVIYLIQIRLNVNRVIAFFLSLIFAVSLTFWEYSVSADVFTFATFLISLAFLFSFLKKPFLAFFVLGLSASHLYISAILFPFFVWYFWGLRPKFIFFFFGALLFGLGFFPQGLLYLRMQENPQINWGHAQGLSGFIDFVRRKEFGSMFLITNPVLTFSIVKVFKHFYVYFFDLFLEFAIILPALAILGLFWGRLFRRREVIFLLLSFFLILSVQLFLLSTIDPTDNSFQISKFYLSSFVLAVVLMGIVFDFIYKKFFAENLVSLTLIFSFVFLIYLVANYKQNDLSGNYFSQNRVLDSLGELPKESLAITVDHLFYFGGLYEQKVDNSFGDIKLLYFPNDKNRDVEKYHPELFIASKNWDFIDKVEKDKILGKSEIYILETISRNLDKPIFILQGSFEESFFAYLKPYLRPYGLWWQISLGSDRESESQRVRESERLLENLRNKNVTRADFKENQQASETLTYAVSYYTMAIDLAKLGQNDEALNFLERSLFVDPSAQNVQKEIDLLKRIKDLEGRKVELLGQKDKFTLTELGNDYFSIGNFRGSVDIFSKVAEIDSKDAESYNNLAASYAALGEKEEAITNYEKALEINPQLDLAKKGLEAIKKQ